LLSIHIATIVNAQEEVPRVLKVDVSSTTVYKERFSLRHKSLREDQDLYMALAQAHVRYEDHNHFYEH